MPPSPNIIIYHTIKVVEIPICQCDTPSQKANTNIFYGKRNCLLFVFDSVNVFIELLTCYK